jgi:hypothetical protein
MSPVSSSSYRHQTAIVGGVAVAGTALILVIAAGLIPGFNPFPPAGFVGVPYTEGQAAQAAQDSARSIPGGPWQLLFAEGFAFTNPNSFQLAVLGRNATCSPTDMTSQLAPDGPSSGNYQNGGAVLWLLMYASTDPSGGSLFIQFLNGFAQEVGEMPGFCLPFQGSYALGPTLDSSVAMHKVLSTTNGSHFAASFPTSNVYLQLQPGFPGAVWLVYLSACSDVFWQPGFGGGPNGPEPPPPGVLYSVVSATNGSVLEQPLTTTPC